MKMFNKREEKTQKEYEEKVIQVDRVTRVTKGGQRLRFRSLVAIGNRAGKIGLGIGKAQEVAGSIQKAVKKAKKNIIKIDITNDTIPHELRVKYKSALLMLKPAPRGTSIIAGGTVRSILELVGIKNVVSKTFGSANKINNAMATIIALQGIRLIEKNSVINKNTTDKNKETSKPTEIINQNQNIDKKDLKSTKK